MAKSDNDASIVALQKTKEALKQIRTALMPFITLLKEDKRRSHSETSVSKDGAIKKRSKPDSDESPKLDAHRRAEAQAAVSCKLFLMFIMQAAIIYTDIISLTFLYSGNWDTKIYGRTTEGIRRRTKER